MRFRGNRGKMWTLLGVFCELDVVSWMYLVSGLCSFLLFCVLRLFKRRLTDGFFGCNPSKSPTFFRIVSPFKSRNLHTSNADDWAFFCFRAKRFLFFFALKTIMSAGKWRVFFTDCRLIWRRPHRPKKMEIVFGWLQTWGGFYGHKNF